jgi:hypothetical protein
MKECDSNKQEFSTKKTVALFFGLYIGAVVIANLLIGQLDIFFLLSFLFFPLHLFYSLIESIDEGYALSAFLMYLGFFIYPCIMMCMLAFRHKKAIFLGLVVVYILLLILNIHGCVMSGGGGPMYG